jgi:hypothetical protein
VLTRGPEHAVGLHQLVGFGEGDPADFGELVAVADEDVGAVGWPGGHVDHGAAGGRVDPAADLLAGFDLEAGLFLDFADAGVGRLFPWFDLACDERPARFAVVAAADQHAVF